MNKLFYYCLNSLTISFFSLSQLHTQFENSLTLSNKKKEKGIKSLSLCVIEIVRKKEIERLDIRTCTHTHASTINV
jgi:hypothetical protein